MTTTDLTQATSDARLVGLWLHGRSPHTQRAYGADILRFVSFHGIALDADSGQARLKTVTLGDLQAFADSLSDLAPASQARMLSTVKSLLAFGHRLGYLPFDVGAALKLPTVKNRLAERILPEDDVRRMIDYEPNERNRALIIFAYVTGARVSEIAALTWADLTTTSDGRAQVTIYGKGGKTRTVLLPPKLWPTIVSACWNPAWGPEVDMTLPVFRSARGGHLDPCYIRKLVRRAAHRAGIPGNVSPHWLRHAHASHALDHGCPIHLVQATLGHVSVATTGRYLHARPTDSSGTYLEV